jgi:hypothetical protein
MVGLDNRSTLDVDATIKNLPLTEEGMRKIVGEITLAPIDFFKDIFNQMKLRVDFRPLFGI